MNDEFFFAPDWSPLIQAGQDRRARMAADAPDDFFAIKDESPPAFDWKPLIQDDMDRQARMAADAPDDSFAMNDGMSAFDWGPLIREDLYQRARMASSALDLSYRYVNPDESATARRISRQTGITYGEALRNPVEADLMHRRQVFGQFAAAHPDQTDWIIENADVIHDDIGPLGTLFDGVRTFVGDGVIGAGLGASLGGIGEALTALLNPSTDAIDVTNKFMGGGLSEKNVESMSPAMRSFYAVDSPLRRTEERENVGAPLVAAGDWFKEIGAFIGPDVKEGFGHDLMSGLGQGVGILAAGILTRGLALPAIIGFGQGANYMADDARQHGVHGTPEGDLAILGGGALGAGTSALTFSALLSPIFKRIENVALQVVARLSSGSLVGGAMAGGEQLGDNALARSLYDPDRNIWQDVGYKSLLGLAVGGILGAGVSAFHADRAKQGGAPTLKDADSIATLVEKNGEAFKAEQTRDSVSRLMDDFSESKAAARIPDEVAAAIRKTLGEKNARIALTNDALFDVYVRPKLARELGLSSKEIVTAHLKGEEVSVDLGRLVASGQARGLKDSLLPHVRRDGEAMTSAEAARWNETGRDAFVREQLGRGQEEGSARDADSAGNRPEPVNPPELTDRSEPAIRPDAENRLDSTNRTDAEKPPARISVFKDPSYENGSHPDVIAWIDWYRADLEGMVKDPGGKPLTPKQIKARRDAQWEKDRRQIWKDEAKNNPDGYSKRNIDRMKKGDAPQMWVEVFSIKNQAFETKWISIELHHIIPQREGGPNINNIRNLVAVTPWRHAEIDKSRHLGYDFSKMMKDIGND